MHPFANFVVAKGVVRLSTGAMDVVVRECKSISGGRGLISKVIGCFDIETLICLETARTSVLQALVDRAVVLGECQEKVLGVGVACYSPVAKLMLFAVGCFRTRHPRG